MTKTCSDCKHCVFIDWGYSNWTVEGTNVYCDVNAHPEPGFDRWYGEDDRLKFAEGCPSFKEGDPHELDVDMEEWDEWWEAAAMRHPDWMLGNWRHD